MVWIVVKHKVKDYKQFRSAFFDNLKLVKNNGFQEGKIFKSTQDPNEVWVFIKWESRKSFEKFAAQTPKDSLESGGIIGQPEGFFLDEIEEIPK